MDLKVCTVVSVSNNEFCVAACNELCVSVHVSVLSTDRIGWMDWGHLSSSCKINNKTIGRNKTEGKKRKKEKSTSWAR